MAKKSEKHQASALDEVRRHVRVFVDLGRVAGESNDQNRFLDQVVVQVARAVEIDHVKVLRYRRRETDLLVAAGYGWKEGVVRSATLSAGLKSPPGRSFQTAQPVLIKNFQEQDDFIHSGLLQEHGIVSLVNVPVLMEGADDLIDWDARAPSNSDCRRRSHPDPRATPYNRRAAQTIVVDGSGCPVATGSVTPD